MDRRIHAIEFLLHRRERVGIVRQLRHDSLHSVLEQTRQVKRLPTCDVRQERHEVDADLLQLPGCFLVLHEPGGDWLA